MGRPADKSKTTTPSDGKRSEASRKMPRIARIAQRLGRRIPDEELRRIPRDLSSQIDHYVYGTPKR
ncbi:MAG: hypothetical protein C5B51_24885 [Terriglobia bacterium]|nr:MAG: hypothetical protein C5B51_24885 [Terriglobia bacterium]